MTTSFWDVLPPDTAAGNECGGTQVIAQSKASKASRSDHESSECGQAATAQSEASSPPPSPAPHGHPGAQRRRSPIAGHRKRCEEKYGNLTIASKACERCRLSSLLPRWKSQLVYVDTSGVERTWLVENPDQFAPYGWGCILCWRDRSERKKSLSGPFETFRVGEAGSKAQLEDLLRHGNHKVDSAEKKKRNCRRHQEALEWFVPKSAQAIGLRSWGFMTISRFLRGLHMIRKTLNRFSSQGRVELSLDDLY